MLISGFLIPIRAIPARALNFYKLWSVGVLGYRLKTRYLFTTIHYAGAP